MQVNGERVVVPVQKARQVKILENEARAIIRDNFVIVIVSDCALGRGGGGWVGPGVAGLGRAGSEWKKDAFDWRFVYLRGKR